MPPMTQDREWGEELKMSTLSSLERTMEMKEGMKEGGRKRGKGRREKEGRGISGLYHTISIRLMDR